MDNSRPEPFSLLCSANAIGLPCNQPPGPSTQRSTSYALNPQHLFGNLVRDAQRSSDIECVANNNDENINVQCSAGFYAAIAKPIMCSISADHSLTVQGIVVTLSSYEIDTKDTSGLLVNRLLKFSLRTATIPTAIIGSLTIHLHHTSRLIQIQGSCVMPDSTPATIWFTENVLLPIFKQRGNASATQIQEINNAIIALTKDNNTMCTPASKRCGGCSRAFSTRNTPIPCPTCAMFFHKTTCWKTHRCVDPISTQQLSLSTALPLNTPSYTLTYTLAISPALSMNSTCTFS